ncbi:MAG: hypothetical protein HYW57_09185 [Ignavibacteriales bacterium]|nr:hypothetical protein [Ignavibacteriales bacterium]
MGQQQLLIIVLTVFVAGLAILTGVRLVSSFNQSNERDLVLHQMNIVLGEAKKYSARPKSIGGGEGSFQGFEASARFTVTDRIRLYVTTGDDWILFQGFGSVEGYDGSSAVQVVAQWENSANDWTTISNVN